MIHVPRNVGTVLPSNPRIETHHRPQSQQHQYFDAAPRNLDVEALRKYLRDIVYRSTLKLKRKR